MENIQKENLVTGSTYIIESTSKQSGQSGTKIGIFEELTYPCGEYPPFAKFKARESAIVHLIGNLPFAKTLSRYGVNNFGRVSFEAHIPQIAVCAVC